MQVEPGKCDRRNSKLKRNIIPLSAKSWALQSVFLLLSQTSIIPLLLERAGTRVFSDLTLRK